MKKICKDRCYGESTIFRKYGGFKKERLSTELDLKSDRPENAVDEQNVNTVWVTLQGNQKMTCEEIAASTIVLKTSIL